mmetsp:Transcript_9931/g.26977  ORF Transcript_9931/g.26977 Transcript_9931/m.26977 type:complete len:307 (+) Transcript_9931:3118-4038(+)
MLLRPAPLAACRHWMRRMMALLPSSPLAHASCSPRTSPSPRHAFGAARTTLPAQTWQTLEVLTFLLLLLRLHLRHLLRPPCLPLPLSPQAVVPQVGRTAAIPPPSAPAPCLSRIQAATLQKRGARPMRQGGQALSIPAPCSMQGAAFEPPPSVQRLQSLALEAAGSSSMQQLSPPPPILAPPRPPCTNAPWSAPSAATVATTSHPLARTAPPWEGRDRRAPLEEGQAHWRGRGPSRAMHEVQASRCNMSACSSSGSAQMEAAMRGIRHPSARGARSKLLAPRTSMHSSSSQLAPLTPQVLQISMWK